MGRVNVAGPPVPTVGTSATIEALDALDWDFVGADTSTGGHAIHPYPAKFPPQLPRTLVARLSSPGDLVVDPFGGSGTTALEAVGLQRRAVSIDANPIAVLLSRVKCAGLSAADRDSLAGLIARARELVTVVGSCRLASCRARDHVPSITNIDKWFDPLSVHELAHLRMLVEEYEGVPRDISELSIGQAAATVSFQESETRYVSVPRKVSAGEAVSSFVKEVARITKGLATRTCEWDVPATSVLGDARCRDDWPVEDGSVQLIVSSPPYPNAYDYHLYHRFRILWTRSDPVALRRVEIGSHLRQQTVADPIQDYEDDMDLVMQHARRALRPGGWCVLVVGDGLYKRQLYPTSAAIERLGSSLGFEVGRVIHRQLPVHRRSVTRAGRRLAAEQLVVLRKPMDVDVYPPDWPMADYEMELAARERAQIEAATSDYSRLTFAKGVTLGDRTLITQQRDLELSDGSRLKNSTYASHGIHRYKGKFYPQLGRCLINLSCKQEAVVLDPFSGSGTVALEAAMLGHNFHGIELSAVGAETAAAKIALMSASDGLLDRTTELLQSHVQNSADQIYWEEFAEETHEELQSWFAPSVLRVFSRLLMGVRSLTGTVDGGEVATQLGEVCLSDIVRLVSHQDPSDLRIRRRKAPLQQAPVEDLFWARWSSAVRKVTSAQRALRVPMGSGTLVQGDSAEAGSWPHDGDGRPSLVDAIVTSPPYASALPYLDTDRLSLAAVFGQSKRHRANLESRLIGSREISTSHLRAWELRLRNGLLSDALPASTGSFLLALSDAVAADDAAGFRRRQAPSVLTRYFVAMSEVLAHTSKHLRPGGDAWFVLGDSKTTIGGHTWTVPTTQEIAAIGKHRGLELVESIPITVTRDNMRHARHAITANTLLHFQNR